MELLLDRATSGRALRDRVFLLDKTKGIYFFDQSLAVCLSGFERRIQTLSVGRPWSARQSRFSSLSSSARNFLASRLYGGLAMKSLCLLFARNARIPRNKTISSEVNFICSHIYL